MNKIKVISKVIFLGEETIKGRHNVLEFQRYKTRYLFQYMFFIEKFFPIKIKSKCDESGENQSASHRDSVERSILNPLRLEFSF